MIKPLEVLGLSLTSTLGNSRESKVVYGPLEIHPLEISMGPWEFQTKTHGNSTIFSLSPLEIPLLLVYKQPLGISACSFFSEIPLDTGEIPCPQSPSLIHFFLQQPIVLVTKTRLRIT